MAGLLSRYYRVLLFLMTLLMLGTVLVSTNAWNPLPQLSAWWTKLNQLSEPAPRWDTRADGVPDLAAVLTGGHVVVASRGFAQAYDGYTGRSLWRYEVYWTLPGGDVVVVHKRSTNPDQDNERDRGYSVIEPSTGQVIWGEHEAKAVWVFADAIVDLSCPDADACYLRQRAHRDNGKAIWSVSLPGQARTVLGAAPALAGTRDPAGWFSKAARGTPAMMPPLMGLIIGDRVAVVDTAAGQLLREIAAPDKQTRVVVSGDRVLLSGAAPANATCRFWLDGVDVRTGQIQWHLEGYDLDTASGVGCEQRRDPLGTAGSVLATSSDNDPVLLATGAGRQVWAGRPGDRLLATDGELAVVQDADRKTVKVIDLLADGRPAVWTAAMGLKVEAAVTATLVIVRDADKGRIVVLSHRPLAKLVEVSTKATVVGYGPRGLVIVSGRRVGFIPVS